jgi:sugar phosphate isomerase/epimerase
VKIKFFCPLWGSNSLPYSRFFSNVKESGYDGVEMSLPLVKVEKSEILSLLNDYGLDLVAQHHETSDSKLLPHKENFRKHLYNLAEAGPLFINSQTGKDYFSFEENSELIEIASQVEKETGVHIVHETHRGKFSFALHITRKYLDSYPDMELGLDVSHWCNVAESLLHDQAESLNLALLRTSHIHARVGYAEGPQVTDPRLPEWEDALNFHLSCWGKVFENFRKLKRELLTITPEFGPYPYMIQLPFTRMPVASQWEINNYMKDLLKEQFS